jgi:23S rRNA pseudouridine2605 synthase
VSWLPDVDYKKMLRLNLFIAKSGHCSRRKADRLIAAGKVSVNGSIVREPFLRVGDDDVVSINGKTLSRKEYIYIVFHKPRGVVSSRKDWFARRTIMDYLPERFKNVYPVGRLDKESSGLLLLTNDGDFCYRLTHPKFLVEKEYLVTVAGRIAPDILKRAKDGLPCGGEYLKADRIDIVSREKKFTICRVVVHEGKKRHIRRLFKALGLRVIELMRLRIGKLVLRDLAPGRYRMAAKRELDRLFFNSSR